MIVWIVLYSCSNILALVWINKVRSVSFIYNAQLKTIMYLLPLANIYTVAANTIGTCVFPMSNFCVSLDTSPEKHIDAAATFFLVSPPASHILFLGTEFGVDSSDGEMSSRCVGIPLIPLEGDTKCPST